MPDFTVMGYWSNECRVVLVLVWFISKIAPEEMIQTSQTSLCCFKVLFHQHSLQWMHLFWPLGPCMAHHRWVDSGRLLTVAGLDCLAPVSFWWWGTIFLEPLNIDKANSLTLNIEHSPSLIIYSYFIISNFQLHSLLWLFSMDVQARSKSTRAESMPLRGDISERRWIGRWWNGRAYFIATSEGGRQVFVGDEHWPLC